MCTVKDARVGLRNASVYSSQLPFKVHRQVPQIHRETDNLNEGLKSHICGFKGQTFRSFTFVSIFFLENYCRRFEVKKQSTAQISDKPLHIR